MSKEYKNRRFCSIKCKGEAFRGKPSHNKGKVWIFHHTDEAKKKISEASKNISYKTRLKISNAHKGEKSHFWKGGITEKNKALRQTFEYTLWRKSVFERDNYTCVVCGNTGGYLHAHHIKRLADFPELALEISNGVTMCKGCHHIETWGDKNAAQWLSQ